MMGQFQVEQLGIYLMDWVIVGYLNLENFLLFFLQFVALEVLLEVVICFRLTRLFSK